MPHNPANPQSRRESLPVCLTVAVVAAALLTGCAQPVAPQAKPSPVTSEDYRRTFEAALVSLKDHGFQIDRQDYRFGRITTKPRISPQFFELWKPDNNTFDQALASTLNDQQRIATIKLDPAGAVPTGEGAPGAAYQLTVEVIIERSSDPTRRLTGSANGNATVDRLSATPEEFKRDGITGKSFVPAGTDPQLEQKLLADIQARLAAPVESAKAE